MSRKFSAAGDISYRPSKWCHDLLPLQNQENLQEGKLVTVPLSKIANPGVKEGGRADTIQKADKVFAISSDDLIAVGMASRRVVAYHYSEHKFLYPLYKCPYPEKWRDVICIDSKNEGAFRNTPVFSLLILTEKGKLIKLEMRQDNMTFVEVYRVSIDSKNDFTQILLFEPPPPEDGQDGSPSQIYLWAPKRKMLQYISIVVDENSPLPNTGRAEPVAGKDIKIRNPELDGAPVSINGEDLSLAIDSRKETILCADKSNHILFECQMGSSGSVVLCGRGTPGCPEEGTPSKQACLNTPCAPLSYHPQDYVEKSRFSTGARDALNVKQPGLPRIILLCDVGNQAVRKLWQFPNDPQAHDLAGHDKVYTLVCDSGSKDALRHLCCQNPKEFYVNPEGVLTITTEDFAYIITSAGVLPEVRTGQSEVEGGT